MHLTISSVHYTEHSRRGLNKSSVMQCDPRTCISQQKPHVKPHVVRRMKRHISVMDVLCCEQYVDPSNGIHRPARGHIDKQPVYDTTVIATSVDMQSSKFRTSVTTGIKRQRPDRQIPGDVLDEIVQWLKVRSKLLADLFSKSWDVRVCDERWQHWLACVFSTHEEKKAANTTTLAQYVDVRLLLSQVLRQQGQRCKHS